jgi:lipoyl(octanoyl) transferase
VSGEWCSSTISHSRRIVVQVRKSCRAGTEPVHAEWLGTVDYLDAWDRQRAHATARADGLGGDVLMLLEHPSVYTAGRRTLPHERPADGTGLVESIPVVDVDRGGKITWHGPGQLVGYPIVGLHEPFDVVDYVRRLEQALIEVVTGLGVRCGRVPGRSGVWLAADDRGPERKVGAIGIRVQRGVTLHGFALNCAPDLSAYGRIVPCGIADAGVTSLSAELGREVTVAQVLASTRDAVLAALDGDLPIRACDLPSADLPSADLPKAVASSAEPAGLTLALDPALR